MAALPTQSALYSRSITFCAMHMPEPPVIMENNNYCYSNLKHPNLLLLFSYMPPILYSCISLSCLFDAWRLCCCSYASSIAARPIRLSGHELSRKRQGRLAKRTFTASALPSDPSLPTFKRACSMGARVQNRDGQQANIACCRICINEGSLEPMHRDHGIVQCAKANDY
jgi:hypothetical protein